MGVDSLHFSKVNASSALNNFDGWYNAPNYPNFAAFATVKVSVSTEICFIRDTNLVVA
jgi:hypothetical protein